MTPLATRLRSPALRYRSPLRTDQQAARLLVRATGRADSISEKSSPDARRARRRRLEAVLFLAREPLAPRKLAKLANLTDGTEARTLVRDLQQAYRNRRGGLTIHHVAGGYRLLTRAALAPWVERFSTPEEEAPLTPPAAETLAIVAYRQPVLRAEVEAIRGTQSGELLRQLMHRGLLRIVGRSEELGRPLLYGTTKGFLQEHGLRGLEDLPPVDRSPAAA